MLADDDDTRMTVVRSGINWWCDFCLTPFGLGTSICEYCFLITLTSPHWRHKLPTIHSSDSDLHSAVCSLCNFGLCLPCYSADRSCLNRDHVLTQQDPYAGQVEKEACRRLCNYNLQMLCDVQTCRKIIEGLYFRKSHAFKNGNPRPKS